MTELFDRKSPRLKGFDYNSKGAYFITICTKNRKCLLSDIVGTPVPTNNANSYLAQFVSTFKRFCNKEYGKNIWQPRAYDHIIRNRDDYEEHLRYVYEKPMKWKWDKLYPK